MRSAGFEKPGHLRLGDPFFSHRFGELPSNDFFNRLSLRLLENAFLFQEIVDARSHMFLAHRSSSFLRLRARVRIFGRRGAGFVEETMQRDKVFPLKAQQHARGAIPRQVRAHFPQPLPQRPA
ncbi:MAG TPA: hypothetical protein VH744_11405 [Terriglobales bacterium]